jgi:hypothetical protein
LAQVDLQRTARAHPAQPFVVVLAPLTAVLAILCALWPAARRRLIWLVLLPAVGALVLIPLTTRSKRAAAQSFSVTPRG